LDIHFVRVSIVFNNIPASFVEKMHSPFLGIMMATFWPVSWSPFGLEKGHGTGRFLNGPPGSHGWS